MTLGDDVGLPLDCGNSLGPGRVAGAHVGLAVEDHQERVLSRAPELTLVRPLDVLGLSGIGDQASSEVAASGDPDDLLLSDAGPSLRDGQIAGGHLLTTHYEDGGVSDSGGGAQRRRLALESLRMGESS